MTGSSSPRNAKISVENFGRHDHKDLKHLQPLTDPAILYKETLLKGRCALLWDWPMIYNGWKEFSREGADIRLEMNRSNTHRTAEGLISMSIRAKIRNPTVTIVNVTNLDALSTNAWHRFAVQFMAWVAHQVALRRYSAPSNVIYALPCRYADDPIPQGWTDLGHTTCNVAPDIADTSPHSWTVWAPTDGLLWDLAWDTS